jgi:LAO/AO transport system kinase
MEGQPTRGSIDADLANALRLGDRLALARAITRVENQSHHASSLVRDLYADTGNAHIIGITGAPGTGKSTLVTAMAQAYRSAGHTVAIVAIDPTSPFSGGAVLGDRVRMRALSGDAGVFVRSMATRGSLGGLSKTTSDVVLLMDAAGFDRILVETVGVGQAEVEVASTAHTTLVVEAPGFGDEVQAIKAGILEIGDILVVNKVDRPGADRTIRALEMMLEIEGDGPRYVRHHGQLLRVESPANESIEESDRRWKVRVMETVASDATGVEALVARIEEHRVWLHDSGEIAVREQLRIAHMVENIVRARLNQRIAQRLPEDELNGIVEDVRARRIDPYSAAENLLASL